MSEPIQCIGHLVNFKGLAFISKLTFGKLIEWSPGIIFVLEVMRGWSGYQSCQATRLGDCGVRGASKHLADSSPPGPCACSGPRTHAQSLPCPSPDPQIPPAFLRANQLQPSDGACARSAGDRLVPQQPLGWFAACWTLSVLSSGAGAAGGQGAFLLVPRAPGPGVSRRGGCEGQECFPPPQACLGPSHTPTLSAASCLWSPPLRHMTKPSTHTPSWEAAVGDRADLG